MSISIQLFSFLFCLQLINANKISDKMDSLPDYVPKDEQMDYTMFEVKLIGERLMVNEAMWSCGDNGFWQTVAYHTFTLSSCHVRMADINLCCAFHDNCYDLKSYITSYG